MDIAVCLDCTSSIAPCFCEVRERIAAMVEPVLRNEGDIRLALIKFRSRDDSWATVMHPFTHSVRTFHHWLFNAKARGGSQDGTRAISKRETIEHRSSSSFSSGDALKEVLKLECKSRERLSSHLGSFSVRVKTVGTRN